MSPISLFSLSSIPLTSPLSFSYLAFSPSTTSKYALQSFNTIIPLLHSPSLFEQLSASCFLQAVLNPRVKGLQLSGCKLESQVVSLRKFESPEVALVEVGADTLGKLVGG